MLNKFLVAGRLTADPEMQNIGENRVCKFTIACDRPKRKGQDDHETDFFNCVAWNRNGDTIASYFKKGDMITIVGEVHINRYEKDDRLSSARLKRSSTEVKVEEIHFSGGKKNNAPADNGNPYAGTEDDPLF